MSNDSNGCGKFFSNKWGGRWKCSGENLCPECSDNADTTNLEVEEC